MVQRVAVVQQAGRGSKKVAALSRRGRGLEIVETHDIPGDLPPVLDDTADILPERLEADLVLAFVGHPDLAEDLARLCERQGVPVVLSGQKVTGEGVVSPPT